MCINEKTSSREEKSERKCQQDAEIHALGSLEHAPIRVYSRETRITSVMWPVAVKNEIKASHPLCVF